MENPTGKLKLEIKKLCYHFSEYIQVWQCQVEFNSFILLSVKPAFS